MVRLRRLSIGRAGRFRRRTRLAWPVILVLWPAVATALSVRTLTLEELVTRSRTIFVGRCVAVREVEKGWAGLPVTEAEFSVAESVKSDAAPAGPRAGASPVVAGSTTGNRVRVRQISGRAVPGLGTRFQVGQEVLLFLHGDSTTGLTSPVGMAQGVFTIIRAARDGGSDLAVRGYGPPRTTSLGALPQRTAAAGERRGASAGPAVELDSLLAAIRRLVEESQ